MSSEPARLRTGRRRAPEAWPGVVAPALRRCDIEGLLAGRIPFIRIPRYLSSDWCDEIARRFFEGPAEEYNHGVTKIRLLGMALAPLQGAQHESYFSRAPSLNAAVRALYRGGADPFPKLCREMADGTGWKRLESMERGRPYMQDVIGAILSGSWLPIHVHSSTELKGLFISRLPRQIAWNIYHSVPEQGGKLIVYNRHHTPNDELIGRAKQGYAPIVVSGAARAQVMPRQGDLIMFDADNYHEVQISEGTTHRVASHSFIGVDPARGEFVFWN